LVISRMKWWEKNFISRGLQSNKWYMYIYCPRNKRWLLFCHFRAVVLMISDQMSVALLCVLHSTSHIITRRFPSLQMCFELTKLYTPVAESEIQAKEVDKGERGFRFLLRSVHPCLWEQVHRCFLLKIWPLTLGSLCSIQCFRNVWSTNSRATLVLFSSILLFSLLKFIIYTLLWRAHQSRHEGSDYLKCRYFTSTFWTVGQ